MDGENRFDSSLLSRASLSEAPLLSQTLVPKPAATDDLFAFWACDSSQNICVPFKLDCRNPPRAGYTNSSISRRFFDCVPGQVKISRSDKNGSFDHAGVRLESKHRKVYSSPAKNVRVFRSSVGHVAEQKTSSKEEDSWPAGDHNKFIKKKKGYPQKSAEYCREFEFCQAGRSSGSSKLSSPVDSLQQSPPKASGDVLSSSSSNYRRAQVVEDKLPNIIQAPPPIKHSFPDDGCGRLGLGSRVERDTNGGRLVRRRRVVSFESQRDVDYSEMFVPIRSFSESFVSAVTVRQQLCRSISEERGRKSIGGTDESDLSDFRNIRAFRHSLNSTSHSGKIQQCSRSPFSEIHSPRVAFSPIVHKSSVHEMGYSGSRSIRVSSSPRGPKVCHPRSARSGSMETQCIRLGMGVRSSLGVSTSESDAESSHASQSSKRYVFHSSSEVAPSVLESRPQSTSDSTTIHHSSIRDCPSRSVNGPSSAEGSRSNVRGLEMWGWSRAVESWSNQQKALLRAGWRKSTLDTYKPAWERWVRWCRRFSVQVNNPSGSELARFLADLHLKEGLAYRTILVHKSVVSTLCGVEDSSRLSSNVLVKQILRSISSNSSRRRPNPSVWDTKMLISWLSSNSVNSESLYEVSRRCAILLLLCSGRRVHDLTLLSISKDSFLVNDVDSSVTLWPIYGSKTDSGSFIQSGWKLFPNVDNPNLNPVRWVKMLLTIGKIRREEANIENLFVTARGRAKAASRTVIAGWVKSVLREAGVDATPGSVRSAVASRSWIDKEPLDKILARANWRSENTFLRFYKKEIQSKPCNTSINTSLGVLFEPVK